MHNEYAPNGMCRWCEGKPTPGDATLPEVNQWLQGEMEKDTGWMVIHAAVERPVVTVSRMRVMTRDTDEYVVTITRGTQKASAPMMVTGLEMLENSSRAAMTELVAVRLENALRQAKSGMPLP